MNISFKIIPKDQILTIIPLVYQLNQGRISESVLESRFLEMRDQNYECAGIYDGEDLIGVSGLWFCTRHYIGRSVELDHVFIKETYRNRGLGKEFSQWITSYVKNKGYKSMELNTYVQNYPSHKFYYNEGYEILGYHFLKQI
ncbi:MAG: GNAT family N-acetyltransferase [Bacteroidota bacterium]